MLLDIVKFPQEKLKELIRSRLEGKDAGLPLNEARDEHPADILVSLYEYEGDDPFRKRFANALLSLLEEVKAGLNKLDSRYVRRLVSLVGRLKLKSAFDCIVALLKESEALGKDKSPENHRAILATLGVLQWDKGLITYWVKLMEEEPIYAEVAFENLQRVDPEVAARRIPFLALLAKENPEYVNLSQLLTYLFLFLPDESDHYVEIVLAALKENPEAIETVVKAMDSNESLKNYTEKLRKAAQEGRTSEHKTRPVTFYTRDNVLDTYLRDKNWRPDFRPVLSAS